MEKDVIPGQLALTQCSSRIEGSKFDPDKSESDIDTESKGLSEEDKSLRLYEILEQIGVSEKVRQVSREWMMLGISASISNRFRQGHLYLLHFGSCVEGSSISAMDPDIDVVYLIRGGVINDASEGIHEPESRLIVQDEWTFPGYVKLQKVSFGKPLNITNSNGGPFLVPDACGRWCNKAVVVKVIDDMGCLTCIDLDKGCEHFYKNDFRNFSKHGPANRVSNMDIVFAYESYNVLNIIAPWVRRKRLYEWPSTDLFDRCAPFPILLVRTGHHFSEEEELEWRISFSFFERELMFSLNPTQHKCYVILKMIKDDILNQALSEEFITSYHLKTCVFWAVENIPEEIWKPEQILRCVCICLWFLLYFVLIKNCPNYFLPTANLFQSPSFLCVQSSLFNVIINSVTGLEDVICRIKCADLGHLFEGSFSTKIIERCAFHDIILLAFRILKDLHWEIRLMSILENCVSMETRITCLDNMSLQVNRMHFPSIFYGFDELAIKDVKRIISLQINLRLTFCFAVKAIATPDESERLNLIKLTRDCTRDFFTASLVHLSLLFKMNKLSECEKIFIDLYERRDKLETFYLCQCAQLAQMPNKNVADFITLDINMLFKNQINCMVFMPEEKGIVVEPLDFELNLSIDYILVEQLDPNYNRNWVSLDGWVYFLFIRYLVYSGLNYVSMKRLCLLDIFCVVTSGDLFHQAVAYNLMGWIFAREGMLAKALQCWRASLERHPHRNAVNRYCVDFFSKCVGLGKDLKHEPSVPLH